MIGFTPSEGSNPGARFTVTGEFPALLVPPAFEVLAPSPSLPPPQRAVRQAAQPQPCPVCDAEGQRIMPTTVHAFMMRDGVPRRIPDRGKFWHYGEEVDAPIGRPIQMGEHPELIYERYGPPTPPTMEEREAQEELLLARMECEAEQLARGLAPTQDIHAAHEAAAFERRSRETAPRTRLTKRRAPNSATTPRTRTGEHSPPKSQD